MCRNIHSRRWHPVRTGYGVLVLVCFLVDPLRAETPEELLTQLSKRREALSSLHHTTRTITKEGDTVREAMAIRWERQSPQGRQVRLVTKTRTQKKDGKWDDEIETVMVNDGAFEWREMKVNDSTMVFKAKNENTNPLSEVQEAVKSGKARIKGRESVAQEPCVVLEVSGRKGSAFSALYWISLAHGVVLKSEMQRADRIRTDVQTIEWTPNESVSDEHFTYKPGKDVTVLDTAGLGEVRPEE